MFAPTQSGMRRAAAVIPALLLALTGCGGSDLSMRGSLVLGMRTASFSAVGNYPCTGTDTSEGYADIGEGSPVTVYNAAGQIVAIGALGKGRTLGAARSCLFPFEVAAIPSGSKFYQVEVSHRGKVTYSSGDVEEGKVVSLTLGT